MFEKYIVTQNLLSRFLLQKCMGDLIDEVITKTPSSKKEKGLVDKKGNAGPGKESKGEPTPVTKDGAHHGGASQGPAGPTGGGSGSSGKTAPTSSGGAATTKFF